MLTLIGAAQIDVDRCEFGKTSQQTPKTLYLDYLSLGRGEQQKGN